MKNSLWLASILLFILLVSSNFDGTAERVGGGGATAGFSFLRQDVERSVVVPPAQEATPGPAETPAIPYPIEPGTSTLGLIIGALIIVLTVLGGVIYASLVRRRN